MTDKTTRYRRPVLRFVEMSVPSWLVPQKNYQSDFYTTADWHHILTRLENGERLSTICDDPCLPNVGQIRRFISAKGNEDYAEEYEHSMRIHRMTMEDRLQDMAEGRHDNQFEEIERTKLRIDTTIKTMGFQDPKRYRPKTDSEVSVNIDITQAIAEGEKRVQLARGITIDHEDESDD